MSHRRQHSLPNTTESRRVRRSLSADDRARIVHNLFHEGRRSTPFLHRFFALMGLSVLIAVLGLLADSTAVVIGAMLVAPLMAPVLGLAAALVVDWPRRAARSALVALSGSLAAVALAALASRVLLALHSDSIQADLPAEILARTAPNLFDLGVALVAGSAGAYAQIRRQAGDALVGVAVAVALVPPLAVIGITLQLGAWDLAVGAGLLFIANVAGILAAAAVTFVACGFAKPRRTSQPFPLGQAVRGALAIASMIMLPLVLTSVWDGHKPVSAEDAREVVVALVEEVSPNTTILAIEVQADDQGRTIEITTSDSEAGINVERMADDLAETLEEGVELKIITLEAKSEEANAD